MGAAHDHLQQMLSGQKSQWVLQSETEHLGTASSPKLSRNQATRGNLYPYYAQHLLPFRGTARKDYEQPRQPLPHTHTHTATRLAYHRAHGHRNLISGRCLLKKTTPQPKRPTFRETTLPVSLPALATSDSGLLNRIAGDQQIASCTVDTPLPHPSLTTTPPPPPLLSPPWPSSPALHE